MVDDDPVSDILDQVPNLDMATRVRVEARARARWGGQRVYIRRIDAETAAQRRQIRALVEAGVAPRSARRKVTGR